MRPVSPERPERPHERELDDEIRGHLALAIKERVDRGDDPPAARMAALRELGYVPEVRDAMRRVWYGRWSDAMAAVGADMRVAMRSLLRAKGLSATVVATLALGIGANAAIFVVVRGVLLRPVGNRREERILSLRQGAPGIGADNMTFSIPEIEDFEARAKGLGSLGDFSTVTFPMVGVGGEPRTVKAGIAGGSFFPVMGLRPVLGRLLTAADERPEAAPGGVLTHRFWKNALDVDRAAPAHPLHVGGDTATLGGDPDTAVSSPADTEIITTLVTSPPPLGASMATSRT